VARAVQVLGQPAPTAMIGIDETKGARREGHFIDLLEFEGLLDRHPNVVLGPQLGAPSCQVDLVELQRLDLIPVRSPRWQKSSRSRSWPARQARPQR